mmetsp:Transcript_72645/g.228856  ORF Transcript_72645/g.228856 Transcript_72645/m.228856 type:complete len:214 (+) Transcript_72645:458-1099(+)
MEPPPRKRKPIAMDTAMWLPYVREPAPGGAAGRPPPPPEPCRRRESERRRRMVRRCPVPAMTTPRERMTTSRHVSRVCWSRTPAAAATWAAARGSAVVAAMEAVEAAQARLSRSSRSAVEWRSSSASALALPAYRSPTAMHAPAMMFTCACAIASLSVSPSSVSSLLRPSSESSAPRRNGGTCPSTHAWVGRTESHRMRPRATTRSRMKSGRT